ncbi:MAG: hypothetical protein C0474_04760 [Sphingobium sp.]|jgi:uncharacterized protein|nr:hypothetical protein [Sphingobium sp.]
MISFIIALMLAQTAPPPAPPPAPRPAPPSAPSSASQPPASANQGVRVDPARIAAAEKLLKALDLTAQYDASFARLIPVLSVQAFDSLKDNVRVPRTVRSYLADPANLNTARAKFGEAAIAGFRARYPELIRATAIEYAKAFSVDELNALTSFYDTPAGQKALKLLPELQGRLFNIGAAVGAQVGREAMRKTLQDLFPTERSTT